MTIICRELDKYGDRGTKIYIVKRDATSRDVTLLDIRNRLNPELEYYCTTLTCSNDEMVAIANCTDFREPLFLRI